MTRGLNEPAYGFVKFVLVMTRICAKWPLSRASSKAVQSPAKQGVVYTGRILSHLNLGTPAFLALRLMSAMGGEQTLVREACVVAVLRKPCRKKRGLS